jgi:hypothetical protein
MASVTDGRDGSPSRPPVVLARAVASARRPYPDPPSVTDPLQLILTAITAKAGDEFRRVPCRSGGDSLFALKRRARQFDELLHTQAI